ncbi:MAG TPA: acetate kinase [Kiritimatiellae bacterium]|nr:acetate kinase [Kiritimatiellia bacterium]
MKRPEIVLVINAGSSSIKFMVFSMADEMMLARGIVERIGLPAPRLRFVRHDGRRVDEEVSVGSHGEAMRLICETLVDAARGVLKNIAEVEAVGHRVVHGGEKYHDSTLITEEVKTSIREFSVLAPLHNPPNLKGIEAVESVLPGIPNVAVFDTAFHHSLPPAAYLYAIPYDYYEKFGVRKYGFHGTSHKYVATATAEYLGTRLDRLKMITCHLGNGASVAAVSEGKVVETSMGMTPLAGLVMGTRCGDIDPGVVLYLVRRGMSPDEVDRLLNKKSGLLGVAGIGSSDMRDVIVAAEKGSEKASRAIWMFVHRLVSYIGAYHAVLEGAHVLVFTGGIGENSSYIRERVVRKLEVLGCVLDAEENERAVGRPGVISTANSQLKAVVMPTNEELMIARETVAVVTGAG